MEENRNQKIITLSFVALAFLTAIVMRVLLESAAATWGVVAKYYAHDWMKHGLPALLGIAVFIGLQFNTKVQVWADEVVTELLKVVWPTKRDTMAMTVVVCVMLIISSFILGLFDFLSRNLVKIILNLNI
ncbi:MAG: preprotein translocase subunit SecE [Bdellovibrionaceae bacterium]|nr:preprotein translocase subunit SecE [Pseudobdellovibrionaceae bacterium]